MESQETNRKGRHCISQTFSFTHIPVRHPTDMKYREDRFSCHGEQRRRFQGVLLQRSYLPNCKAAERRRHSRANRTETPRRTKHRQQNHHIHNTTISDIVKRVSVEICCTVESPEFIQHLPRHRETQGQSPMWTVQS